MKATQQEIWSAILGAIRARLAIKGETQTKIAGRLGVSTGTIARWLNETRGSEQKTVDDLKRYMEVLDMPVSSYFGDEQACGEKAAEGIPLIGLAACGYAHWQKEVVLPLSVAAAPPGERSPEMFAVVATGESLIPAGIMEGHVAFCDPRSKPEVNDVVFVERSNDTVSLKMYRGGDETHIILEGWLPPRDGAQEVYTLRVPRVEIKRIAPVIFVRRRR